MVVVKNEDVLRKLIEMGYKPYYHKGVGRWYLRKGKERHIIAKELEPLAEKYAKEYELKRMVEEEERRRRLEEAIELRARGAPLSEVIEKTGISRSKFYRATDELKAERASTPTLQQPPSPSTILELPTQLPPQHVSSSNQYYYIKSTFDELLKELRDIRSKLKGSASSTQTEAQQVYTIRIPLDDEQPDPLAQVAIAFEEILPPVVPKPFTEKYGMKRVRCRGCGNILYVRRPLFPSESYVFCENCNALIKIIWFKRYSER
jgi:DNA-binding phage protein